MTLLALPPITPPRSLALVWASSISNHLVLSAEVPGALGADADNHARERLGLAFAFIDFSFGASYSRFSYYSAYLKTEKKK